MSRWEELKFRGTVKKELREAFAKAFEARSWEASGDDVLTDFGEDGYETNVYLGKRKDARNNWAAAWWNGDGWDNTYDKETGLWQFKTSYNLHGHGMYYLDFESEVIPYLMESVEWMESWMEPFYEDDHDGTCLKKTVGDHILQYVGFFEKDGSFRPAKVKY